MKTLINKRRYYRIAAFIWAVLVFIALIMPDVGIQRSSAVSIPHLDKIVHFSFFFIMYFLFKKSAKPSGEDWEKWRLFIWIGCCALGTEFLQIFLKDRSFELFDIIANITGAFVALIFTNRN